jgi:hypothetical protein
MYRLLSIGLLFLAATFIAGALLIIGIFLALTLAATIVIIAACVSSAIACCIGSHHFAVKAERQRVREDQENKGQILTGHQPKINRVSLEPKQPGSKFTPNRTCLVMYFEKFFYSLRGNNHVIDENPLSYEETVEDDKQVKQVFSDRFQKQ